MKKDIFSMTPDELQLHLSDIAAEAYRAGQIFEWLHRRGAASFEDMDNLPKPLRAALAENFRIGCCRLVETRASEKDGTRKFLFALEDGVLIESVRIEYSFGYSVCISAQAGCRMGCRFCVSASGGLLRNLTAGEMCAQVYAVSGGSSQKPAGIVLMGCGEPLDNFDQTLRFLELISHQKGLNMGGRHITVSTCGLVPQMKELAALKLQINLAVSLHSADDQIRKSLMPVAKRYSIGELMEACRYYIKQTNRRITFEYALVRGLNDSPDDAAALGALLAGMLCHVNLIPLNPGAGGYSPSRRQEAEAFAAILKRSRIQTTVRRTIGSDVDAACGQLAAKRGQE
jgi:23S rRNA (adenine2503-C2)-methyltransferase